MRPDNLIVLNAYCYDLCYSINNIMYTDTGKLRVVFFSVHCTLRYRTRYSVHNVIFFPSFIHLLFK